ncbi:MAG: aminomethyl transferase family protein [Nitrospirae bacterium]|nr:aminomethyl transferase family protein [Nitrospirota bacterium]
MSMKRSPLYEIHKSIGVSFTEFNGWEIPAHYGDPETEHLAVRSNAGMMDFTHRGKIRISGKDRTKFLQNILSQDINKLTPGTGGHAALLNTKGHMLAYMRIYSDESAFLIDTESGQSDKIIQILNRYLFREEVKIEDVTLKNGLITVQGPHSRDIISRISGADINEMEECSNINLTIKDINCRLVKATYTGEEGYGIYTPWDSLQNVWEAVLMPSSSGAGGIIPAGHDAYNSLRIEAGIPVYSIDMDEDTIPIEANLDNAISYTKGCYIGQETIARINFKGHVNRKLTGFTVHPGTGINHVTEGRIIVHKGDRIYAVTENTENSIGIITSACFSPTLNDVIAIGYLRMKYCEPGTEVRIDSSSHQISAVVTVIPFYTNKQNSHS